MPEKKVKKKRVKKFFKELDKLEEKRTTLINELSYLQHLEKGYWIRFLRKEGIERKDVDNLHITKSTSILRWSKKE